MGPNCNSDEYAAVSDCGWASLETNVATVNSTGLVTAVSGGTASVEATLSSVCLQWSGDQVLDGSHNPIRIQGMEVWDSITTSSPNDLNLGGYTTTCTFDNKTNSGPCGVVTTAAGQFQDTLSVCAPACYNGASCILAGPTNAKTTWNVAGYFLTSDIKTYSYYCDHYLVNGQ